MRSCVVAARLVIVLFVWSLLASAAGATTIVIDGFNDFAPADTFATSTPGFTGYATHDGVNLFLGFDGASLSASPSTTWLVAYLGTGAPGTTSGLLINTQQPNLPFSASYVFRRRLDFAVQDVQGWTGSSWATAPIGSGAALIPPGNYIEVALNLAALGSPTTLQVAAYLLSDQVGFESSYAALPASAFSDGYDPNVGAYLTFVIPEPSTALLLAFGLIGVAVRTRR